MPDTRTGIPRWSQPFPNREERAQRCRSVGSAVASSGRASYRASTAAAGPASATVNHYDEARYTSPQEWRSPALDRQTACAATTRNAAGGARGRWTQEPTRWNLTDAPIPSLPSCSGTTVTLARRRLPPVSRVPDSPPTIAPMRKPKPAPIAAAIRVQFFSTGWCSACSWDPCYIPVRGVHSASSTLGGPIEFLCGYPDTACTIHLRFPVFDVLEGKLR